MNSKPDLTTLLSKSVVLGDGAMGTMLYSKGAFINTCFDELNMTKPDIVKAIHDEYVASGVDFLETNTFGANEIKLAKYGLAEKAEQINIAGVEIATQSAGDNVMVAGAIGPLGIDVGNYTAIGEKDVAKLFEPQIKTLASADVDFLMFETFSHCDELLAAIRAAINCCDLPIVAQMTTNENNETIYGDKIIDSVARISEFDQVTAVGLNCAIGPAAMLSCIEKLRNVTDKPLSAQPNAGLPRNIDGRTLYMCNPEYMAEYAKRFFEKGVKIIGGCCGTTPAHTKEIVKAVRPMDKAMVERPATIEIVEQKAKRLTPQAMDKKSELGKKLAAGEKVFMVEISPPRGADVSSLIEKVKLCKASGIDAINIPDGPRASSRLSAMITAIKIEQSCNIETVLHFCCRDRNIIGMQSDLLGIGAIGLKNVLIITGDPPKLGEYPDATAVFDVDSIGLTKVLGDLNCGLDIAGNSFPQPIAILTGVGANPVATDIGREIDRYRQKIAAGAEFAITQPVFDEQSLLKFLEATKDCKVPVIAGIWPFTSFKNAEFMANEVPGVVVPPKLLDKMSKAKTKTDGIKTGIEIARDMLEKINNSVAGFAVSAPFGNVKIALAAAGKMEIKKL
ncbi:MAG: bifunctional homocysteine S-methyltransferase/methylenetetrahydrofolate reductase [Anaerohalosphaeraceae bacterium]|nr:bifunctional homocysteine S-methyltransferase/methylenetetrahydrofolate reductase [Anaerohalosphaeraceae bacterium]